MTWNTYLKVAIGVLLFGVLSPGCASTKGDGGESHFYQTDASAVVRSPAKTDLDGGTEFGLVVGDGSGAHAGAGCGSATGFSGDEQCLLPPSPSAGAQIHFGPSDYTDAASVAPFVVAAGSSTFECIYVSAKDLPPYFFEHHVRMRPDVYSVDVFETQAAVSVGQPPGPCVGPIAGDRILIHSVGARDVLRGAPENQGIAMAVGSTSATIGVAVSSNAAGSQGLSEVWVNLIAAKADEVTELAEPLLLAGGVGMNISPKSSRVVTAACAAPSSMRILAIGGNYFSHTTAMGISLTSNSELLWSTPTGADYRAPPYRPFDSVTTNPPGNVSGALYLAATDGITFHCNVDNTLDANIKFGSSVTTQEECLVFGWFVPMDGGAQAPWQCTLN